MNSSIIHGLWKLVEATQVEYLLTLGDNALVQLLTGQLMSNHGLNTQEAVQLQSYISDRLPLIRDLARDGF